MAGATSFAYVGAFEGHTAGTSSGQVPLDEDEGGGGDAGSPVHAPVAKSDAIATIEIAIARRLTEP